MVSPQILICNFYLSQRPYVCLSVAGRVNHSNKAAKEIFPNDLVLNCVDQKQTCELLALYIS